MQRLAYQTLLTWRDAPQRKPLILRGARQVGKTTLLKSFAENEYANYLYLNFEDKPTLKELFLEDLDPKRILQALGLFFNKSIDPLNTLLIFDEIQECPEALNSLKYFCEDAPEYAICAAGSLLGVKLIHTKGFPVGKVTFADLYPMNFLEFLDAIGEHQIKQHLDEINTITPLSKIVHDKLCKLFNTYLFIGGMPEVVASYANVQDFEQIRKKQADILDAYSVDFAKHAAKTEIMKITEVWDSLTAQLAKENKKFVFSKVKTGARGREYDNAIQWLVDAGLIYKVFNISKPKLPLSGYIDVNAFKIYVLDVGLLGAMANVSPKLLIHGHELFSHFKGSFIENYVAQSLKPELKQLYYWTSDGTAELDYIMQLDDHIIPIEVKSGSSRQKKSLKIYREKFKPDFTMVISPENLIMDGNIINCPLYLVDHLSKLVRLMTHE